MYYRRKILLNLIAAFGEQGLGKIKLQKLLFLFCQQQNKPAFDFVPYTYGCFSFQANKDLQVLESHYQLIKQDSRKWFLDKLPELELKSDEQHLVNNLLFKFKGKNNKEIVNYVYDRYPYYSIHSKWSMSASQKEALMSEKLAIESKKQTCLFTIGYEGQSIDAYLNTLVKNNVSLLCDVRKNPLSMKYGFSKNQLRKYCESLNMSYDHIPELGIESQKRKALDNKKDYEVLFKDYRKTLPEKHKGLTKVVELLEQSNRIALTCFERESNDCHRHCISDYLQEKYKVGGEHL